jgi:hypothetical protein
MRKFNGNFAEILTMKMWAYFVEGGGGGGYTDTTPRDM